VKPVVSIITPAFNANRTIAQAIESVQAQTFQNWEMLIVDDVSTDDTCAIVEKYVKVDGRIRLLRQRINGGPARTRNVALKVATGRYIAFLDSDDLWLPGKLERQLAFMAEKGAVLSYTLYRRFTGTSDQPGSLISLPRLFSYQRLLKNTGIAGCLTVIIDTEFTGPIEMPVVRSEDYALWLSLLRRGFVAQGLMEDLGRYRVSKSSVSSNKLKTACSVWNIYRDLEKLSVPYAAWCLGNYAWNAYRRNR
jgi:teichuronic acid biosynthesis glycosyltransferase TuaG